MELLGLAGSAVSTDVQTSYAARIMVISIIPFIIAQIPKIFKISSGDRWAVFIALLFSVALLLAYCVYQVPFFIVGIRANFFLPSQYYFHCNSVSDLSAMDSEQKDRIFEAQTCAIWISKTCAQ